MIKQKWIRYNGEYEKEFYDVMTKSGKTFLNCWPNAGTFHHMQTGFLIYGYDVYKIRLKKDEV